MRPCINNYLRINAENLTAHPLLRAYIARNRNISINTSYARAVPEGPLTSVP